MTRSLAMTKWVARREIDTAAGEARQRYITDIPGQDQTYIVKREQASAYAAAYALDPDAPVPSYIAAEATALSMTAIDVASAITAQADDWHGTINPSIEAARLGGKAAVTAASDEAGVDSARDDAISTLEAI